MPNDDPRLVLAVGQRMIDVMTVFDGLMESTWWDEGTQEWKADNAPVFRFGTMIAEGLNRLKYRPEEA